MPMPNPMAIQYRAAVMISAFQLNMNRAPTAPRWKMINAMLVIQLMLSRLPATVVTWVLLRMMSDNPTYQLLSVLFVIVV